MSRGDLVSIAMQVDDGRPCPALVIQSDRFSGAASVTVLLMTWTLLDAPLLRVTVEPSPVNGLRRPAQVMIDKPMTVGTDRIEVVSGRLDDATMLRVNRSLALFLGLAD